MTVTRRVHRFEGGGASVSKTYRGGPGAPNSGWTGPSPLETQLNTVLAPAERIVGAHYLDGYWVFITESFGLGPVTK